MKKTIVFITGAGRSGSTMLDLILGNANNAFSCGELYAIFRPTKSDHIHFQCGCGNSSCKLWNRIKKYGEKEVYYRIFDEFKNVDFIIDSSKDLNWIKDQKKYLKNDRSIDLKYLLIYKHPISFAFSRWKRGTLKRWKMSWIEYHFSFFSLGLPFRAVSYEKLISSPQKIFKQICNYVGMEYFKGKEEYWNKTHHLLFGSRTTKKFFNITNINNINSNNNNLYNIFQKNIEPKLRESLERYKLILDILTILKKFDIENNIDKNDFKLLSKYKKFQFLIKLRRVQEKFYTFLTFMKLR